MPKMKTCKAVAKRIKRTAKGKLLRHKSGTSHLMSCKNAKRRRNLRKAGQITLKPFVYKISRLLAH